MKCIKCNGELIECYADNSKRGILVKNPKGDELFRNKLNTNVNPYVCRHCGYTEWYAKEPERLI